MEQPIRIRIEQLEDAKDLELPKYMSKGAAGMDLYAHVFEEIILHPGEIKLIPTGIKIALPDGYEAQIRPRSGLALKYGIGFPNSPGTIDADYRGEIKVIMTNWGQDDFAIRRGDRIAQMVINKVEIADWDLVISLDETERGEGGFGHTGN
ncbi:dUTP diphosphatase [Anaeromicropila herbilytica]|uniref:Deoxyuridine 5'-triphosphate nucleotidohydrolase n=1 Tax=Anaeromicropila herbilytica TaxID=2785025 RepID=A0A7R7EM78_9FIRM|nr:dUTP diphosphatase [Anaeromicropila herbilytica]BCN31455.1 deoxyuridine 5'-triphosphate nucleotidohydrolase [Anaeromicropila herbilytica]